MARRAGGKAANRKARQRSAQRAAQRPAQRPDVSAQPTAASPAASVATPSPAPSRASPAPTIRVGSTLTVRERAEYHYVERDLRNIGLLTVLMAVLLLVAYIVANALSLV